MPQRRAYGGQLEKERRQVILDAAAACITEYGIEGATMKRVAARAGVSTGMIAYYFKDKNELMTETLSSSAARFRTRLGEAAGTDPGILRLQKIFELSFPPTGEAPPSRWPLWLAFASEAPRNPDLGDQLKERIATVRADMERCAAAAIESGDLKTIAQPEEVADLLLALYHGLGALVTVQGETTAGERAFRIQKLALELLDRARTEQ
jgi:TetR/AcrR family transcriptional regulator, transcriptional repressor of bet genes